MRLRRILLLSAGLVITVILAACIWSMLSRPHAPAIHILRTELAGILDENGREMWLVDVCICNPREREHLYVRDAGKPVEVKIADRWTSVGLFGKSELPPSMLHQAHSFMRSFVVPEGTQACRVHAQYTGSRLVKGRLTLWRQKLPARIAARIPFGFRWPQYAPRSKWWAISSEVRVPPPTPQPIVTSADGK